MALAVKRKDGGTADILAHRALATHEGRPAIVGVALDITERKRMEEDLRLRGTLPPADRGGAGWDTRLRCRRGSLHRREQDGSKALRLRPR